MRGDRQNLSFRSSSSDAFKPKCGLIRLMFCGSSTRLVHKKPERLEKQGLAPLTTSATLTLAALKRYAEFTNIYDPRSPNLEYT